MLEDSLCLLHGLWAGRLGWSTWTSFGRLPIPDGRQTSSAASRAHCSLPGSTNTCRHLEEVSPRVFGTGGLSGESGGAGEGG